MNILRRYKEKSLYSTTRYKGEPTKHHHHHHRVKIILKTSIVVMNHDGREGEFVELL